MPNSAFVVTGSERVFNTGYFAVYRDDVRVGGKEHKWHRVKTRSNSVFIVAANKKNEIALINQYRVPVRRHFWEVPSGGIEKGESPRRAAIRELDEEARYVARRWKRIGKLSPLPYILDETAYVYLARDLERSRRVRNENPLEGISVVQMVPLNEVKSMARSGEIDDSQTLACLALAMLHLE